MTKPDDELLLSLQATFTAEAVEYLQTVNTALLQLERTTDDAKYQSLLHEAFRAAHNMKGAARTVEFKDIQNLSHAIENVLQLAREHKLLLTPAICDVLYHTLDTIKGLLDGDPVKIERITREFAEIGFEIGASSTAASNGHDDASEPEPAPVVEYIDNAVPSGDSVRVAVTKLDALMADTGELLTSKISAEQSLQDLTQLQYQLSLWPKTLDDFNTLLRRVNGQVGLQLAEMLVHHQDYLQSVSQNVDVLQQSVARNTLRLDMITGRIQDEIRQVRLVPFQSVVSLLQRTVRDAARSENKQVAILQVEGAEVELDKKVLEALKSPLLHILRNAVAHGIEDQAGRRAAGKRAEGTITLTVQQRGNEVLIAVSDDGKGFDFAALSKNGHYDLNDPAVQEELIQLAFMPGVSTAKQITDIAGRGVGLDVVRQSVEDLQGRVEVDSLPGQGTTFHLMVPVSLTTSVGLVVRTGNEHYILPLLAVEKIIQPESSFSIEGQPMINVDNRPIPLVPLAAALNRPFNQSPAQGKALAVVVKAADQRMAFGVDDILAQQEVTIKPLSSLFPRVDGVIGAAILGGGEPVLVLNAADLVKFTKHADFAPMVMPTPAPQEPNGTHADITILVVDDSITTRTLEKNILQAAGYHIITATDGQLALKQLKEHHVNLVVSDVQMPNLDGIGLAQTLRENKQYSNLPLILVTSLESQEDRERGLLAGANAYIVKRGFDQAELLLTIQRLLGE